MNTFAETSTNGSTGAAVACGVRGNQIATTAHTRNEATGTAYRSRRRRTAVSAHTRAAATAAAGKKMAARSSSGPERRTANHSHGATARSSGHTQRRRTGGAAWARRLHVSVSITPIVSNTSSSEGRALVARPLEHPQAHRALFARPGHLSHSPEWLSADRSEVPSRPGLGGSQRWDATLEDACLLRRTQNNVPQVVVDLLPRSNLHSGSLSGRPCCVGS
jgi:hypothetical protein